MSNLKEFTKGFIKENPTLVTLLGMCPTLAVTTQASNGIGMGLATTFVLVGSNIVISLLKKIIPDAVRLPCYIVIIAGFVTLIEFLLKGYVPTLYDSLGIFLSLITVNCIILGRAEVFVNFRRSWNGAGIYSFSDLNGYGKRNFRQRNGIWFFSSAYKRIANDSVYSPCGRILHPWHYNSGHKQAEAQKTSQGDRL